MSDKIYGIPDSLKTRESVNRFKQEYLMIPEADGENNKYDDYVKMFGVAEMSARIKRDIPFTYLGKDYFILVFMDIPSSLVKKVDFISDKVLDITFVESFEFCVEKYFKTNFDVLKDKKLILRYINRKGELVRTDEYIVSNLLGVKKESLDIDNNENLKIKVTLECSKHDISTCKE